MAMTSAEGERDAVIIPFPLHRVRSDDTDKEYSEEAIVHDIPGHSSQEVSPRAHKRAHNVAVHQLSSRSVSTVEMRTRLEAKELPPEVVEGEIEELRRVGLLDDQALAEDLVDRYSGRERWGKSAVISKLRDRGIPEQLIENAVSSIDPEAEAITVEDVARERLRKMGSLPRGVAHRRLFAFLQRKGFRSSDIAQALDKVLA